MYLGNQPALSYTSFAKQDFTTSATTSYTLDYPVANENEVALFINFVRQEPTTAYTASGTSLTLTSATSASDDMYAVFIGKAVQTVNPPAGSVTNSMLASGSFSNITGVGTLSSGLTLSDNLLFDTASKGIYLGTTTATASNLLNDYEEGTWTPVAYAGVSSFSVGQNTYTKIGRSVTIYAELSAFVSKTGSALQISGLPFTPSSGSLYMQGTAESDAGAIGIARTSSTTGRLTFFYGTTSRTSYVGTNLGGGLRFSLTYFTDA